MIKIDEKRLVENSFAANISLCQLFEPVNDSKSHLNHGSL